MSINTDVRNVWTTFFQIEKIAKQKSHNFAGLRAYTHYNPSHGQRKQKKYRFIHFLQHKK
jgi:hypothetical protein